MGAHSVPGISHTRQQIYNQDSGCYTQNATFAIDPFSGPNSVNRMSARQTGTYRMGTVAFSVLIIFNPRASGDLLVA